MISLLSETTNGLKLSKKSKLLVAAKMKRAGSKAARLSMKSYKATKVTNHVQTHNTVTISCPPPERLTCQVVSPLHSR